MRTAFDVLNGLETAELTLLALVALRMWWRHRGPTNAWLAGTFGILGLLVTAGRLVPQHPHGFVELTAQRVLVASIALFPFFLYRFTLTFRSVSKRSQWLALWATGSIVIWSFALPHFPEPGEHRSAVFMAYLVSFLAQWTVLLGVVAVMLWNAARHEPTVARRRMRTLAFAAVGMALALLVAGTSSNTDQIHPVQLVTQVLVLVTVPLFLLGVAPPAIVLLGWRANAQSNMRDATIGLVGATSAAEISESLLPRVTQFIGGHGAAILGTKGELLGSYGLEEADTDRLLEQANHVTRTGGVFVEDGVLWLPLSNGWLVMVTTAFTPFFGQEETKVLLAIGVITDMALSRAELLERDREHVEAMRDFVSIASHDLRTPTAAIVGYAAMLERKWDRIPDDQKRQMVEAMSRQGNHLGRLVEDLLTVSRLDASAIPSEPALVVIRHIVDEVISDLAITDVEVNAEPDVVALIDPEHLRRIITNYLRNAQVYGAAPYTVTAAVARGSVMLSVSDCGAGVPEEFRHRLFQRFARADKKTSSATGGTGLGLSIVQGLAQNAGGRAWHTANQPSGSVFGVTLPVPVPQQQKEDRWTSSGSSSLSRTKKTSAG